MTEPVKLLLSRVLFEAAAAAMYFRLAQYLLKHLRAWPCRKPFPSPNMRLDREWIEVC